MSNAKVDAELMRLLLKLAEGIPGAITVCRELNCDLEFLYKLDEWNIRGSLLWLVYKDMLNFDAKKLAELIRTDKLEKEIELRRLSDERFKHAWDWHIEEASKRQ